MLDLLTSPSLFLIFACIGSFSAILGSLIAALPYRGRQGEKYSPFNHFISELGEQGVSQFARAFNFGLILCGLALLPATMSLGLILPGVWSKLGILAGVITAVSIAGVGVFPMNNLTWHVRTAVMYFRMGLVMVLLFTIAIAVQTQTPPVIPRLYSLAGIPAIAAYAFFLIYSRVTYKSDGHPLDAKIDERPRLWGVAAAEWLIFLTTIPWFLAIALGLME